MSQAVLEENKDLHKVEEAPKIPLNLVEPKTRAAGGVWLLSSDFPHSFQHIIVYHNLNKYPNVQSHGADKWLDVNVPYISNEKDVMIKMELDEESLKNCT